MFILRRPLASASRRTWQSSALVSRSIRTITNSVVLDYQLHAPANASEDKGPVLILHGLFGSKRNWNTLAQGLSADLERPVYALDLRNHGTSPHASQMTYTDMAQDVLEFMHKHNIEQTTIIGHSMGGKVAMAVALSPYLDTRANLLKNLIVVDIAPVKAKMSPQFCDYIGAMQRIEQEKLKTRKEAADFLSAYEKDPSIRAFLLTNLVSATSDQPHVKFRVPVGIIGKSVADIGDFPYSPGERAWAGRTLFIKGSRSAYINRHGIPLLESFFPNYTLEALDAGHWVHAERPNEFKKSVVEFVGSS
ncbi:alpha/beta-hydrolase [Macrolepiota fuliginosa MF-IS2]|uniref:Alpha/beta-hydrolase n=1 Tax=Macrolepiota fuliginosa MF-IS2 TaxID=1400762 RepID=A0A9P6C5Y7_9AGAR|nr:alpha/beta-hydrolase [Macrolepiota fuliginosa MF-IS2]